MLPSIENPDVGFINYPQVSTPAKCNILVHNLLFPFCLLFCVRKKITNARKKNSKAKCKSNCLKTKCEQSNFIFYLWSATELSNCISPTERIPDNILSYSRCFKLAVYLLLYC